MNTTLERIPTEATQPANSADLSGEYYETVLRRFHHELQPKSYLEIGTLVGTSLKLSTCPSIAIDPGFRIQQDVIGTKKICAFFQMPSDDFFAAYNPTSLLGRKIDLAFLDGMHRSEFLLRDFAHTEAHCSSNSIIILHDCVPVELPMTEREPGHPAVAPHHSGWWTGDVWRTAVILKRHRPDLQITALDAPPTGLICITGLNPTSTWLMDRYYDLVQEMLSLSLSDIGLEEYYSLINLESTSAINTSDKMTSRFWL